MKKINLIKGQNLEGQAEYYLVGLDNYEDFDLVLKQLIDMGLSKYNQIDSFHYRTGWFRNEKGSLRVIYHEDVGIYVTSVHQPCNDEWMQMILNELIAEIDK